LAKVGTARLAERAIARARASSGVAGFMARNRLIGYHNFALGFQNAGGDNQMYLLQAARAMIAEAPSAATAWLATPPRAMDTVDDCLELLRHREDGLRAQLSTGLAEAVASGADDFTAWDTNVGSALAFAEAHLVRNVAEHFHLSAVEADDPAERQLLLLLCELLMREEIADHEGWYRAKGVLEASVPHEELAAGIGRICERLLDDLDSLVRMLDVPVPLLHSSATDERYFDRIVPSVSCSGPGGSAELG
jgi:acyl-CoA oxidase